jgi:hypothetical protein
MARRRNKYRKFVVKSLEKWSLAVPKKAVGSER